MSKYKFYLLSAVTSSLMGMTPVVSAKTFTESIQQGSVIKINFRTRYEDVSEEGKIDSNAWTTRTRLSYQSGAWNGFSFFTEFDDVTEMTNDVDYMTAPTGDAENSGTAIIADPEGTEVNQGYLAYTTLNNQIKYGRQRLIFDNTRFVGNVGWRQNEQTYDGISVTSKSIKNTNITYAYIHNVNRVFGEDNLIQGDHKQDSHLFNVAFTGLKSAKLIGYGYLLNNESVTALSSDTLGLRWQAAPIGTFGYNLEYAKQTNAGATENFEADYMLGEALINVSKYTVTLGYELLGSDEGLYGFTTPLATLHAFQGWADKFLVTPILGLEDKYIKVGTTFLGLQTLVSYHKFNADKTDADYGEEIDLSLSRKFGAAIWTAKYANYSMGDAVAIKDTSKFWVMADWNF